ncbi:MAG: MBL fold metallo-hydrolase [Candidatus Hydrogenedentes bacterium]|nr:MBL fold metallo-hydrolase [Candidatus Hydrogenedentota bacterium]
MIEPVLKDEALLADIAAAESSNYLLHIWWLGQSGFLLKWADRHVLLDPYLSDSLTTKYADTDKPHVRMTARAVDPMRLDFIDIVTSSHNHTDHLDADTLCPLREVNPGMRLVIPEANRAFVAERLTCPEDVLTGVDAGESIKIAGITIDAVPAAHEEVSRDHAGRCHYLGYVLKLGPFRVYHSGDTVRYEGVEELLRPFAVDLALLPINGARPERRVAGNLDGGQAARLAKAIGARMVVPCHYEMFEFNTAAPDLFEATCDQIGQAYRTLRCGQRLTLPAAAI